MKATCEPWVVSVHGSRSFFSGALFNGHRSANGGADAARNNGSQSLSDAKANHDLVHMVVE